jgi:cytochrome c peroxidase
MSAPLLFIFRWTVLDFVKVSIDSATGVRHVSDRLVDLYHLQLRAGALIPALLLLIAGGQAQSEPSGPRQGPGDFREGYEHADYETKSLSLQSRRGAETNLLAVLESPPLGLPAVPVPADNPVSEEKVRLGRKLFFDRRLSANNTISCAMCHVAEQGFAQNELRNPVGIEGKSVRRNAPSIYNVAYVGRLFHDGREMSLENQVWQPLLAHNEMANLSIGLVIERIRGLADYDSMFEKAFGRGPDVRTIGMALASYQRMLVSGDSAFDRWYFANDKAAISAAAQRGFALFQGKAACISCHTVGPESALFTDGQFHNTGIGYYATMRPAVAKLDVLLAPGRSERVQTDLLATTGTVQFRDLGRYEVTGLPADRWRYRTPTLRNVALTAPYMHDGSLASLRDVLEFYNRGGVPNESLDPRIRPLGLSDAEIDDLLAFLQSLTGSNVDALVADAFAAPIGGS